MSTKLTLTVLAVTFLLLSLALYELDGNLRNETTPYGIVSFEFIWSIENAKAATLSWGQSGQIAAGIILGLDFLYIALYSLIGFILPRAINKRISSKRSKHGHYYNAALFFASYLFPLAGFFDIIENLSLIRVLLGSQEEVWTVLAWYCALFKFSSIGVGSTVATAGLVLTTIKARQQKHSN